MTKKILLLFIILLLVQTASARQGQITLLTVAEHQDTRIGGTADLYLELRPGSGRVFIDSFPLTQLDTQISTRFAKEFACNFLEYNCNQYDFFYTIRASSSVVGGPSAGAATTILTIAVLDKTPLINNVVMTGTINSGGIIGPVAGVEAKSRAARASGFDTILLPKWSVLDVEDNETVFAEELSVEGLNIITVSTVEEALLQFTGKNYSKPVEVLQVPTQYTQIMGEISGDLCRRYYDITDEVLNQTREQIENAESAMERGDFYSAASFCFSANVAARTIQYENLTSDEKFEILEVLAGKLFSLTDYVNEQELNTFSDLEASVIVKERLLEAQTLLDRPNVLNNLAYIEERLFSAQSWAKFFEYDSPSLELDSEYLNSACNAKLAEVDERISYLAYMSGTTAGYQDQLDETRVVARSGDYAFCLFRATRIKADINALLITVMVRDRLDDLAQDKLELAHARLSGSSEFSILGYSYYDYALSLRESNPNLAIIFSEYALEFGNLDMYFPPDDSRSIFVFTEDPYFRIGFMMGVVLSALALILTILIIMNKPRKAKSSPGKKR